MLRGDLQKTIAHFSRDLWTGREAKINILSTVRGCFSGTMGSRTLKKGEASGGWNLETVMKKQWEIHMSKCRASGTEPRS